MARNELREMTCGERDKKIMQCRKCNYKRVCCEQRKEVNMK